jgi:hypothetical protein
MKSVVELPFNRLLNLQSIKDDASKLLSHPDGVCDLLQNQLKEKGRAIITVQVDLHDESESHVFSAEIDWFITKLPTVAA